MHSSALKKGQVGVGDHLWLDRAGRPVRGAAIREQIKIRTKQAFGRHVWPHPFRDCAVTELVDCAPEEIGIAPDLLGHADFQTTKKHYIQAVGMKAHARVQEVVAVRRRAATSRTVRGHQVLDPAPLGDRGFRFPAVSAASPSAADAAVCLPDGREL